MPRPPHVIVIAAWFPPAGGGGVLRMAKLARYLPGLGWDVTVIASDDPVPDLSDADLLAEIPPEVRILRVRGPMNALGGPIGTVATRYRAGGTGPVVQLMKAAARALFIPDRWIGWARAVGALGPAELPNATIVLSSGPPHSGHLAGRRLAKRLGVPHVVDLRDDWAGNPLHASPAPWHGLINGWYERRTLDSAAAIVAVSEEAAAVLAARRPKLAGRIHAIPNGVDLSDLAGLPERRPAPMTRPVEFLYAGFLRTPQHLGRLPDAFATASDGSGQGPRLTFLGSVDPVHRSALTRAVPPERLQFLPPTSHREALAAMAAADVLVVLTGGGGGAGPTTMTGKLFEYLAFRRPILLVGPEGPAARLVRASSAGFTADPEDVGALTRAIIDASSAARDAAFVGAPDPVIASFDRARLADRWSGLLRSVSVG